MIFNKKRIRSIRALVGLIKNGRQFTIGIKNPVRFSKILSEIGFSDSLKPGETILPSSAFGPVSFYNAEGKYKKHKNAPMETAYRTAEWYWKEWRGPYDRVERSRLVDVPYKRYPRTFIEPPSIELTILSNNGDQFLVGPIVEFNDSNREKIIHIVNLFLEIFGECEFFTENLELLIKTPVKRLNWRILPSGQRPWPQLKKEIEPIINNAPKGNRPVIEYRLETINKYSPDFAAVGKGGFRGYVVLGFTKKNLYTLESLYYGNATYILDERWEELSKRTKAEILNEKLQTDRIVHMKNWTGRIKEWLTR